MHCNPRDLYVDMPVDKLIRGSSSLLITCIGVILFRFLSRLKFPFSHLSKMYFSSCSH